MLTLKQVLYARASDDLNGPVDHTNSHSDDDETVHETLIIFTMSKGKTAKQKDHKKEVNLVLQKYI